MVTITNDYFSVKKICESGQCFRLREIGEEKYALTALGHYMEIAQKGNEIVFGCTQQEFDTVWNQYFDMETDYGQIISAADRTDAYLCRALSYGEGIRILRQDLWEMIISFIISQQNNIKRIRKCVDFLCERYGERKQAGNTFYYDFPTAEALAGAPLSDLYACNLGYRSRYIHDTSASIAGGAVDLGAVAKMEYDPAKTELMKLCGVGTKVADCICLFALHQTDAFPRDTHINKVLARQYPAGFPFERYRGYAGILQQYIFYYDLQGGV